MINEFQSSFRIPRHISPEDSYEMWTAMQSLYLVSDFLQDSEEFDNPGIRELVTLVFPLNGNFPVKVTVNPEPGTRMFINFGSQVMDRFTSQIVIPREFASFTAHNNVAAMTQVVHTASVIRDILVYDADTIRGDDSKSVNRANAYTASLLTSLLETARNNGFVIPLSERDYQLLQQYPYGIDSLPEEMRPRIIPELLDPNQKADLN